MNNILTSISLEKSVQSSLRRDVEKSKKKYTRHTIESVKADIESFQGYQLLSTEYLGNKKKLNILCPAGHNYMVIYTSFQKGVRCLECFTQEQKKAKPTIDAVKQHVESFKGYKLTSIEYVNSSTKLEIICPQNHNYRVTYCHFLRGARCPECYHLSYRRTMVNGEEWEPRGRKSKADIAWAIAVKKRDGHICQACNIPSKMLCAHHIESFARNPDLQTELSNGVTLCQSCHIDLHTRYGQTTATRADLKDFIWFKRP